MSHRLDNYLRTYRKRAGLSQDEVAFLLGSRSGAKVSRYELFRRLPTLETALALEAIFGVPVRELFAGLHERGTRAVASRARVLLQRLAAEAPAPGASQKLASLRALILQRAKDR